MSRQQGSNIVYVSGRFLDREEDIKGAFRYHDIVELRAKDAFIELAIQLAEHFVKKGWATYEQLRSSLTTNQQGDSIPQVLIRLNYQPEDHSQAQEKVEKRKQERKETAERRDQARERKEYRQREGGSTKNTRNEDKKEKNNGSTNNRKDDEEW